MPTVMYHWIFEKLFLGGGFLPETCVNIYPPVMCRRIFEKLFEYSLKNNTPPGQTTVLDFFELVKEIHPSQFSNTMSWGEELDSSSPSRHGIRDCCNIGLEVEFACLDYKFLMEIVLPLPIQYCDNHLTCNVQSFNSLCISPNTISWRGRLENSSPHDMVSKIVMTLDWKRNAHQRDRW